MNATLAGRWVATCFLVALCLWPLAGPTDAQTTRHERLARQVDYLDDPALFEPAWQTLLAEFSAPPRLFSVSIEDRQITLEAAAGAGRLDRWTVRRGRFLGLFERDIVSGPQPVRGPPAGFETALFTPGDIAMQTLPALIEAAVQRAALDDPARVTRIGIGAPETILQPGSFGRLRVTLSVASGRESAVVVATPDGQIVAADLSQTNRSARLDMLASDDWPMQEAQAALMRLAGEGAIIRTIQIGHKHITLRTDNRSNPAAADFLGWDLSGARRNPVPTLNPARDGVSYLPFTLDEVDFTRLPQIRANALAALPAGAEITDISASKTLGLQGPAAARVTWHVTARFPDAPAPTLGVFPDMDQLGRAELATDGGLLNLRLPRHLRPPVDWQSGAGLQATLEALRETLAPDSRIQQIYVNRHGALIQLEDPAAPGTSIGLALDDDGLRRDPAPGPMRRRLDHAFRLSDLDGTGAGAMAQILDEAYRQAGAGDRLRYRAEIYGSAGHLAAAGLPLLTVWTGGPEEPVTYRFATGDYVHNSE